VRERRGLLVLSLLFLLGAGPEAESPLARLAAAADPGVRAAAAEALLAALPPAELERQLPAGGTGTAPATPAITALANALGEAGPALLPRLQAYLGATAAARARRLAAQSETAWTDREIAELLRLSLLDPPRFVDDPGFRERALGVLAQSLDRPAPTALRDRLLDQLGGFPGFDFAAGERVGWAWGALPRRSSERRIDSSSGSAGPKGLRFDADDGSDGRTLAASVYSLPSAFFDARSAATFLAAVRALGRERRIVVLADLPLARALTRQARALDVDLLLNHGRAYSPWPRDPFSLVHEGTGKRVVVLVRPNLQPGREEDANLGSELVQDLPPALDTAWGEPQWSRAQVPFHNGQVLLTARAAWISLHTLEPRILALLGETRVPVASFATAAGIDRYLGAARRAATELAGLYGRPVRFVHPLPESGPLAAREALMTTLGGGAGYDLDSILSLLPHSAGTSGPRGKPHALVADLAAGRELLARLTPTDGQALVQGYGLVDGGLAPALAAAQTEPRPRALAPFLDLVAAHLKAAGFAVDRLPLLFVPVSLLRDGAGLDETDFLLTWNNVVVERLRGRPGMLETLRAEGFSMLLPAGDAAARAVFARAGVHLDLLPPLVPSIVRNGGYRCASNHLRR
jgi:hypothetical protein